MRGYSKNLLKRFVEHHYDILMANGGKYADMQAAGISTLHFSVLSTTTNYNTLFLDNYLAGNFTPAIFFNNNIGLLLNNWTAYELSFTENLYFTVLGKEILTYNTWLSSIPSLPLFSATLATADMAEYSNYINNINSDIILNISEYTLLDSPTVVHDNAIIKPIIEPYSTFSKFDINPELLLNLPFDINHKYLVYDLFGNELFSANKVSDLKNLIHIGPDYITWAYKVNHPIWSNYYNLFLDIQTPTIPKTLEAVDVLNYSQDNNYFTPMINNLQPLVHSFDISIGIKVVNLELDTILGEFDSFSKASKFLGLNCSSLLAGICNKAYPIFSNSLGVFVFLIGYSVYKGNNTKVPVRLFNLTDKTYYNLDSKLLAGTVANVHRNTITTYLKSGKIFISNHKKYFVINNILNNNKKQDN